MHDLPTPMAVAAILKGIRYPVSTELVMQDAVENQLCDHLIPYTREARMGPTNRIDFLVEGGIGIEVKTRCTRRKIYRQLARYADHEDITSLILITGTFMPLPETMNGKPVFLVSTSRLSL